MATSKKNNTDLQIFDRSHLKVNKITQDAIIKAYNANLNIDNLLCGFLLWTDNNTYILDGNRYLISNDTPIANIDLVELYINKFHS